MLLDKILVVDDDARVIRSLQLSFPEYELVTFQDPNAALKYLAKPNSIALILLDVYMKPMDGIVLLGEIRKINNDVPVIMMTAYGSMDIAISALRNQANDFIEKPFNMEDLRDKVKVLLREKSFFIVSRDPQAKKVERIKRFIERNCSNISLDAISEEVFLSPKHISRLFRLKSGTSYRDFKLEAKINKAKGLLKTSSLTVFEIADKLGYLNPESFMKIFKRKVKLTPTEFRNKRDYKRPHKRSK